MTLRSTFHVRLGQGGSILCFWGCVFAAVTSIFACDIPVYEYTIQNWQRDCYEIFYIYHGAPRDDDAIVNDYLRTNSLASDGNANVKLRCIDASSPSPADTGLLSRLAPGTIPAYVVLSPKGRKIHSGKLTLSTARNLLHSPRRGQLAEQLCKGRQGMLILLHGNDEAETVRAKRIANHAAADARMKQMNSGVIEISRNDLAEKWLIGQLLAVESDLADCNAPMVFSVFGRGHVMEPLVGKGISEDNVRRLIEFMNSDCACEIKSMSRGVDIITNWDWQTGTSGHTPVQERPLKSALFDVKAYNEDDRDTHDVVAENLTKTDVQKQKRSTAAITTAAATDTSAKQVDASRTIQPDDSDGPTDAAIPAGSTTMPSVKPPAAHPAQDEQMQHGDGDVVEATDEKEMSSQNLPANVFVTLFVAFVIAIIGGITVSRRRQRLL